MAFTLGNICGFDTRGSEEYQAVYGTPTYETTNERTSSNGGLGAAIILASGASVEISANADGSASSVAYHRVGFAFRAPSSFTDGDELLRAGTSLSTVHLRLKIKQSGANYNLEIIGPDGSTSLGTGSTNLSTATWYHGEAIFFLNDTTGTVDLYLDGVSEISASGVDTRGATTDVTEYRFCTSHTSTYWVDDFVCSSSSTSDTTLLGTDAAVYTYQNSKGASAVPDAGLASVGTSGGDNLNTETWDTVAETPGVDTSPALYTASGAAGAVDLDGPGSETAIDTDAGILAIKGIWRAERGTGGGTTHYLGLGDAADTNVADTTVSLTTSPANYAEFRTTNLPTASQNLTQGFGTSAAQDITCYEMWASVLYVPSDTTNDLLADDVESASNLTVPSVGQEHALLAADVQSVSSVSVPVLSEIVNLTANSVESGSEVSVPVLTHIHNLNAADVESGSELTVPVVGQIHAITADDVESAAEVTTPVVAQVHALLADDLESASSVSVPAIGQVQALLAEDVESAAEVTTPTATHIHVLTAASVESASEVTAPAVTDVSAGAVNLLAEDVESASEVSVPVVGQIHAITADDLESASEISAPSVGQVHAITADDVESASSVSVPTVAQIHALLASSPEAASEVTTPAATHIHVLRAESVEAQATLGVPVLGLVWSPDLRLQGTWRSAQIHRGAWQPAQELRGSWLSANPERGAWRGSETLRGDWSPVETARGAWRKK